MNYLDFMKKYTEHYNKLDNNFEKNKILFVLLGQMYKKKFDKDINIGVLLQTLTKDEGSAPLTAVIKRLSKEEMIFDEKDNEIKIGEVLSIKETSDLDNNHLISVELIDKSNNIHNRFLLGQNENILVIDHNFPKKKDKTSVLSPKTTQTQSLETRTFDSKGIEIKRQIVDTVTLGVANFSISFSDNTIEDSSYQFINGLNNCMVIQNETTLERDPNCFLIAKLESKQETKSMLPGDYKIKLGFMNEQDADFTYINTSKTCYVDCYSGYYLGAGNKFGSYEDAIANCADFFEYFSDTLDDKIVGICPPHIEIPSLNNEIKQRFEKAKVYSQDYCNKHNK